MKNFEIQGNRKHNELDMIMQITIITLCITFLFAGLASAKMWQDDFKDGELDKRWTPMAWMEGSPTDWKVKDGILKGHWPNWYAQMLFLKEYPSLDYTIQMKGRIDRVFQISGYEGLGFIFRSSGPGAGPWDKITPFYLFGITTSCAKFFIAHNGAVWHDAKITPENYIIGQWYTLKLVVKGNKFLGYVDDKLVCKLRDNQFKGKFVGLITGPQLDVSFDDFMISDKVDNTAFDEMGVSPKGMVSATWASLKSQ